MILVVRFGLFRGRGACPSIRRWWWPRIPPNLSGPTPVIRENQGRCPCRRRSEGNRLRDTLRGFAGQEPTDHEYSGCDHKCGGFCPQSPAPCSKTNRSQTHLRGQPEGVSPRILATTFFSSKAMRQIAGTHVLSKAASQPYYSGEMQPCSWLGKAKGWNAQDMGFALPRKGRRACELAGTVSGGGWDPATAVQAAEQGTPKRRLDSRPIPISATPRTT